MSSPLKLASEVAALLDSDPIMARQVVEHLSPARLVELLEIPAPEPDDSLPDMDDEDKERLLEELVKRFKLSEVIAAYRKARRTD